jgi:hypothetical protein
MGAVGPASAICSFWVVQVPPPKKSYSSEPSTKDLKEICDVAEGFRAQLTIQAYI